MTLEEIKKENYEVGLCIEVMHHACWIPMKKPDVTCGEIQEATKLLFSDDVVKQALELM